MQISNVGPRRTPLDRVAERLEEMIRVVVREQGLPVQAGSFRPLQREVVDDGAGNVGRPVDAVMARALRARCGVSASANS